MKINDFLIEDIAWTLRNFTTKIKEWEDTHSWERNYNKDPYKQAAHAMLITTKIGFGDCYPIDMFIENVRDGNFIDYDGSGYFVNAEGNKISSIMCNVKWLQDNIPEDAKFIMWFNK